MFGKIRLWYGVSNLFSWYSQDHLQNCCFQFFGDLSSIWHKLDHKLLRSANTLLPHHLVLCLPKNCKFTYNCQSQSLTSFVNFFYFFCQKKNVAFNCEPWKHKQGITIMSFALGVLWLFHICYSFQMYNSFYNFTLSNMHKTAIIWFFF